MIKQTLSLVWHWLTAPSTDIKEIDAQRRARLLSVQFIVLILMSVLGALTTFYVGNMETFIALSGLSMAFVMAYGLSRTRHYLRGAIFGLSALSIGTFAAIIFNRPVDPSQALIGLVWLSLAVILGTLYLPQRGLLLFCVINGMVMLLLPLLAILTWANVILPFSFFFTLSALVLIVNYYRNLLEQDRQIELRQNRNELATRAEALEMTLQVLAEKEATLRSVIESSIDAVYVKDLQGHYVLLNQAATNYIGKSTTDVIGQNDIAIFGLQEGLRIMAVDRQIIEDELQLTYESELNVLDKTARSFLTTKNVFRNQQGQVIGLVGVSRDVTEWVQTEIALKQYSQQLEETLHELQQAQEKLVRQEKLAFLGQLAGSVGHELRNPLGVISNAIYLLNMVLDGADPMVQEYLALIEGRIRESEKIVTDLLSLSKNRQADQVETAVISVIDETLQRHPPPENVRFSLNVPTSIPPAYIDAQQIRQVLTNLVTNAYQAMPEGGLLSITATLITNYVQIDVQDMGKGMSPETLGQIFEPLFTTKTKGIGLGLAISRNLVQLNQGQITAVSAPGQGSTFTLTLPTTLSA